MRRLAIVLGAMMLAAAPATAQQSYNLTLAGASPGGFWALIHAGVNKAFAAQFPGSVITYRTTGGGFANIPMVSQQRVDLGLAHDGEIKAALDGTDPYKQPIKNLRAIAVVYDNVPACQLFLTKAFAEKHGIATFADFAAKKPPLRVAVNRRGNVVHNACAVMFQEIGVKFEDIKAWGGNVEYAGSSEAFDLLGDGRVDMVAGGDGAAPGRRVLQVSRTLALVLLPAGKDIVERAGKRLGMRAAAIKGGTYAFQPNDVWSVWLGAAIVVNEGTSDKVAYDLAKAMVEKIEAFKSVHRAFTGYTPKTISGDFLVPYHPGAERYFKEAGLR